MAEHSFNLRALGRDETEKERERELRDVAMSRRTASFVAIGAMATWSSTPRFRRGGTQTCLR